MTTETAHAMAYLLEQPPELSDPASVLHRWRQWVAGPLSDRIGSGLRSRLHFVDLTEVDPSRPVEPTRRAAGWWIVFAVAPLAGGEGRRSIISVEVGRPAWALIVREVLHPLGFFTPQRFGAAMDIEQGVLEYLANVAHGALADLLPGMSVDMRCGATAPERPASGSSRTFTMHVRGHVGGVGELRITVDEPSLLSEHPPGTTRAARGSDSLEVHLRAPSVWVRPDDLGQVQVGDQLLAGFRRLSDRGDACTLAASTGWRLASVRVDPFDDAPSFCAGSVVAAAPQPDIGRMPVHGTIDEGPLIEIRPVLASRLATLDEIGSLEPGSRVEFPRDRGSLVELMIDRTIERAAALAGGARSSTGLARAPEETGAVEPIGAGPSMGGEPGVDQDRGSAVRWALADLVECEGEAAYRIRAIHFGAVRRDGGAGRSGGTGGAS